MIEVVGKIMFPLHCIQNIINCKTRKNKRCWGVNKERVDNIIINKTMSGRGLRYTAISTVNAEPLNMNRELGPQRSRVPVTYMEQTHQTLNMVLCCTRNGLPCQYIGIMMNTIHSQI